MSKESWPEVVGMDCHEAEEKIKTDKPNITDWNEAEGKIKTYYPNITVQVLRENSFATMDYRTDRVRITVNGEGKVTATPNIG